MKTSPNTDVLFTPSRQANLRGMFFVSFTLHLIAVAAMLFLPNLAGKRTFYSPVYSVRLVSLPPGLPAEEKPQGAPAPAEPARTEPAAKAKEKPLSLAPKDDPQKKISEAIEQIRKRREVKKVDSAIDRLRERKNEKKVDEAIDRLRSERDTRQVNSAIEGIRQKVTVGTSGAVETSGGGRGGASSALSLKLRLYCNVIFQKIRGAWVLPDSALGGKKNLETVISIRIARDGQIEDIQFEKKSGNATLDESALRAVKKANPLPPLPPGEGDRFDVGIVFNPSDL